jgi:hypothetical protein
MTRARALALLCRFLEAEQALAALEPTGLILAPHPDWGRRRADGALMPEAQDDIETPKPELPKLTWDYLLFPVIAAVLIVLLVVAVGFALLALLVIDVFDALVAKAEAKQ